jgi:DNA-binding transcriptional LysR family regulator
MNHFLPGTELNPEYRIMSGSHLDNAETAKQACSALHDMATMYGLRRERIGHSSALSVCAPMVLEGLGVALLPERLVEPEVTAGKLHQIAADWLPDPLSFFARYAPARSARYVVQAAQIAKVAMQGPLNH